MCLLWEREGDRSGVLCLLMCEDGLRSSLDLVYQAQVSLTDVTAQASGSADIDIPEPFRFDRSSKDIHNQHSSLA